MRLRLTRLVLPASALVLLVALLTVLLVHMPRALLEEVREKVGLVRLPPVLAALMDPRHSQLVVAVRLLQLP